MYIDPTRKVKSKPYFSCLLACSRKTSRTGKDRIMTSVMILIIPYWYHCALLLMQVFAVIDASQAACMGRHWNSVVRIDAKLHATTMLRVT